MRAMKHITFDDFVLDDRVTCPSASRSAPIPRLSGIYLIKPDIDHGLAAQKADTDSGYRCCVRDSFWVQRN